MATGTATGQDPEDQRSTNPWGVPLPWYQPGRQSGPPPADPTPPWGSPIVVSRANPVPPPSSAPPVPAPPAMPAARLATPASTAWPPAATSPPSRVPPPAPTAGPPGPNGSAGDPPVLAGAAPSGHPASGPVDWTWPGAAPVLPARRRSRARLAVVATFTVLGVTAASSWGYVGYQAVVKARTIAVSPLQGRTPGPSASVPGLPAAGPDASASSVAAIVAGLQAAVASRDEDAFLRQVDPQARDFADHWRSVFRGIVRVGLADVRFTVDPARIEEWDHDGYASAVFAPVAITYAVQGFDPAPVATVVGLTFGQRNGSWWLVDDEGGATRLPMGEFYEPWLIGDVGVARRAHVVVVGDVDRASDNERLATSLERAAVAVRAAVPTKTWNGKVVAFASTDEKFINAWFGTQAATEASGGPKEPATIAAEVRPMPGAPVYDTLVDLRPASARIAVTPLVLKGEDPRGEAVLRHEVTHVALALAGTGRPTTWLVEGMAEYVAYRAMSGSRVNGTGALARRGLPEATWSQLRRGTWKPLLDQVPGLFYSGDTQKVSDEYTSGWFACLWIASRYGEKKLFALYAAQAGTSRDLNPPDVDARTLKQVLGIDRATLVKQTAAYARDLRRSFA